MHSFSTDEMAPADRFEHWREVRSKSLAGVTIELDRERRASFAGWTRTVAIGGATVSTMEASPYIITRSRADIARMASNSLCVNWQVSGAGTMDIGNGTTRRVGDGAMIFSHSDMPFTAIPERTDSFHYRMLRIPLDGDIALDANLDNLLATTSGQMGSFARPISALFHTLITPKAGLPDPATIVIHLTWLFLLASGRLKLGLSESRTALRSGLFHVARQILARDLHRYALSPSSVASELGISLRQLHVLFEPGGRSFSRTLADLRIEQAFNLFETEPRLSVTEVAQASGFESQATFYRAFRNAFDMTPGDKQALTRSKARR